MSNDAEVAITRLITGVGKMARKEFADIPFGNAPFAISFPLDGDDPDHAKMVCERLQVGLSKEFGSSVVSTLIEDSHYKVRIDR